MKSAAIATNEATLTVCLDSGRNREKQFYKMCPDIDGRTSRETLFDSDQSQMCVAENQDRLERGQLSAK